MQKSKKILSILLLYGTFGIYSIASVVSKLAAGHEFLSVEFCIGYGMIIALLLIYAILWQKVLKIFPLSFAYANKAIVIPLGMLWGWLLFGEAITWNMLLGVVIIMSGVILIARDTDG